MVVVLSVVFFCFSSTMSSSPVASKRRDWNCNSRELRSSGRAGGEGLEDITGISLVVEESVRAGGRPLTDVAALSFDSSTSFFPHPLTFSFSSVHCP